MVVVRAPATSANLGSGFDVFGVALGRPADLIRVRKQRHTTISVSGIGAEYIPTDPDQNTAGVVAEALDAPAHIEINKGVRPSSGLGSSAASAAATAVALNELYDRELTRDELVQIAAKGEEAVSGDAHTDNVAPAIFGGFTIASEDGVTAIDASLPLVACLPEIVVSTREAREVLPQTIDLSELVQTVGAAATLTVGMARNNPTLVGRGLHDSVVTPARAALIDGYTTVREAAVDAGATGVTVSGAGPTMLAVTKRGRRRAVASAMIDAFDANAINARAYQTRIGRGTEVFETE